MKANIYILFSCYFLSMSGCAREYLDILKFPEQVKHENVTDDVAKNNYVAPENFKFIILRNEIINNNLVAQLELANTGDDFLLIVNPYGGEFPYGGTSPFSVDISPSNGNTIKYVGQLYPPAPPMSMQIDVEANSKLIFLAKIPLDKYVWQGTPEILLNWTFYYYQEPYPKGTIKLVLPEKNI